MTEDTLCWLFSTIAQTHGAIVGIMGMLTFYRLQNLSRYREGCKKGRKDPLTMFLIMRLRPMDYHQKI